MSSHQKVPEEVEHGWTFLTNHTHVLLCLERDPHVRLRDVADLVGITERAVQRIVAELEEAGYVRRSREGRRNVYELFLGRPLRHPLEAHHTVHSLLRMLHRARR
jgi:Mn-dependent DtxR family transcriptional regulator